MSLGLANSISCVQYVRFNETHATVLNFSVHSAPCYYTVYAEHLAVTLIWRFGDFD